jgi:DNA repair protein RadC
MTKTSIRKAMQTTKSVMKIKLVTEPTVHKIEPGESITLSQDAESLLRKIYENEGFDIQLYEAFVCLFMNRANKFIGYYVHSVGGMAYTAVDAKLIMSSALLTAAHNIILCHNHPSGNRKPSVNDVSLTKLLVQAGEFLSIKVMDHIILTNDGYYSFADMGEI